MQRRHLARVAGAGIAGDDEVVVQVQPDLPGPVQLVHIDLDLLVGGEGGPGQGEASQNRR